MVEWIALSQALSLESEFCLAALERSSPKLQDKIQNGKLGFEALSAVNIVYISQNDIGCGLLNVFGGF